MFQAVQCSTWIPLVLYEECTSGNPGNLELPTPVVATTGSPPCAVAFALISMCRKVGLEGRFSLWAGADWCACGDLGFLSWSHLRTGCQ